jgi:hypothetical protein
MHASLRSDLANDLITVMFFAQALSGEPDNVFLGHIAVPASRIVQGDKRASYARPPLADACMTKLCTCAAGREEGWYDLRGKQGDVIQGSDGAASVLMSLVASPAKPLPHHIQGFMLSKGNARRNAWQSGTRTECWLCSGMPAFRFRCLVVMVPEKIARYSRPGRRGRL